MRLEGKKRAEKCQLFYAFLYAYIIGSFTFIADICLVKKC